MLDDIEQMKICHKYTSVAKTKRRVHHRPKRTQSVAALLIPKDMSIAECAHNFCFNGQRFQERERNAQLGSTFSCDLYSGEEEVFDSNSLPLFETQSKQTVEPDRLSFGNQQSSLMNTEPSDSLLPAMGKRPCTSPPFATSSDSDDSCYGDCLVSPSFASTNIELQRPSQTPTSERSLIKNFEDAFFFEQDERSTGIGELFTGTIFPKARFDEIARTLSFSQEKQRHPSVPRKYRSAIELTKTNIKQEEEFQEDGHGHMKLPFFSAQPSSLPSSCSSSVFYSGSSSVSPIKTPSNISRGAVFDSEVTALAQAKSRPKFFQCVLQTKDDDVADFVLEECDSLPATQDDTITDADTAAISNNSHHHQTFNGIQTKK
jgi:hypothetical protein